jgi:hypothetical protein
MATAIPTRHLKKAISEGSLPTLKDALAYQRRSNDTEYPAFVQLAFRRALTHNLLSFVAYLLENEASHVDLTDNLILNSLRNSASIPVLELLVAHGWDINQQGPRTPMSEGRRLIDSGHILYNYDLVAWLVERGAIVDDGDPEAITSWPPPLLELCGSYGSVRSFVFLRDKGAKLGRRTLHLATLVAAELGADPSTTADATPISADQALTEEELEQARKREAAAMLRYLVDDLKLDLNQIEVYSSRYITGPPICFAASTRFGASVVRWLLDKGADPTVSVPGMRSPLYYAAVSGNKEAERLIKQWMEERGIDPESMPDAEE